LVLTKKNSKFIAYHGIKNPEWSSMNYNSISDKYLTNPAVYKCVNLISRNLSVIPIDVIDKKDQRKLVNHEIIDLINKPNMYQTKVSFFENVSSNIVIHGEAFIEILRDKDNKPLELHILRSDKVNIVYDKNMNPYAYEYFNGEEKRIVKFQNICHIKNFNPVGQRGISPLQSVMKIIDIYDAAINHNYRVLQNSGRPSGALVIDNKSSNLTDEQRAKLRDDMTKLYQGTDNAGKMMLLEGPFKWVEMAISAKDFDYMNAISMTCGMIALALDVPIPLLGGLISSQPTYSNYKEAQISLFNNTIIPMIVKILNSINEHVLSEYSLSAEISDNYLKNIN
jgi:HK97 family phage portal protein